MPHLITTNGKTFELQENENLLDALERTGHEVEYQCKSGYCGACRVKLCAGRVTYDETPLAFIRPDEILPCCARVQEDLKLSVSLRLDDQLNQLLLE